MSRASGSLCATVVVLCSVGLTGCPWLFPEPPAEKTQPTAAFSGTPLFGDPPLTVQFTDQSDPGASPIVSWQWDFGDGLVSTQRNPSHVYYDSGQYTVTLEVTTARGGSTRVAENYVTVNDVSAGPQAAFSATPLMGEPPLTVSFTDESEQGTSAITSWRWDFGDGRSSTQQHPTHVYNQLGRYDVTLTVQTDVGVDAVTVEEYVAVVTPPTASFDVSAARVTLGTAVAFTDTSDPGSATITDWQWDFGDGRSSEEQHPEYVYESAGAYTVTLEVTTRDGSDVATVEEAVEVYVLPEADFTATNLMPQVGQTVYFKDQSTPGSAAITDWLWDFGDGHQSTAQNPSHAYQLGGAYDVALTVTTAEGQDSTSKAEFVEVVVAPTAAFSADPLVPPVNTVVQFTDESLPGTAEIDQWYWDFGDGGFSEEQNPMHAFSSPGLYTVTLTVGSDHGTDTATETDFIEAVVKPSAAFDSNKKVVQVNETVQFTDYSVGGSQPVDSWSWAFGDGGTSSAQNPIHAYQTPGTYTVTLTITAGPVSDTKSIMSMIRVVLPPEADFEADRTETTVGAPVQFTDTSDPGTADIASRQWDFGDGATSTIENPAHVYNLPGAYTVSLTVATDHGSDMERKVQYVRVFWPLEARFTVTGVPQEQQQVMVNLNDPVQFTNYSTPGRADLEDATWIWDFGDGESLTVTPNDLPDARHPTHNYAAAGVYDVSLTIEIPDPDTGGVLDDTLTRTAYIDAVEGPQAAFSAARADGAKADPLEILEGETVQFTDESDPGSGTLTGWQWDFGDDAASSVQSPAHVYVLPGVYTVSLKVTGDSGMSSKVTEDDLITVLDAPTPDFEADTTTPWTTTPVAFANQTQIPEGALPEELTWLWDFGNGQTSEARHPAPVTYGDEGAYTVSLTVRWRRGDTIDAQRTEEKTDYVVASIEPPTAAFSVTERTPGPGEEVRFLDESSGGLGAITQWEWDFGDGTKSFERNPFHAYYTFGSYTVSLTVRTDVGADDTLTETDFITVGAEPPAADFVMSDVRPYRWETISFYDRSDPGTGPITKWQWDFGDGETSLGQNVSHTFMDARTYTITLTVTTPTGSDTTSKTLAVQTVQPVADWTVDKTLVMSDYALDTVTFQDLSHIEGEAALRNQAWRVWQGNADDEPGNDDATRLSWISNLQTYQTDLLTEGYWWPFAEPGLYSARLHVWATNLTNPGDPYSTHVNPGWASDSLVRSEIIRSMTSSPLDRYVREPDFTELTPAIQKLGTQTGPGYRAYLLQLAAHQWLPAEVVGDPTWVHYVVLIVPDNLRSTTALLYLSEESLAITFPGGLPAYTVDENLVEFASESGSMVAAVYDILKRNVQFADTAPLSGDELLAYSFNKFVNGAGAPVARFSASPTIGPAPLTVRFDNRSDAGYEPITGYRWDFGDGEQSTDRSPQHTYDAPGQYTVTLTVDSASGSDMLTAQDYIYVTEPGGFCTEAFTAPGNAFDLSKRSVFFTRNEDEAYGFSASVTDNLSTFYVDPEGGAELTFDAEPYAKVELPTDGEEQQTFTFFGQEYASFYVSQHGYITFGGEDTTSVPTLDAHFAMPRVSGLFAPLEACTEEEEPPPAKMAPDAGACLVSWRMEGARAVVTFENVTSATSGNLGNFQIELYCSGNYEGAVRLTWIDTTIQEGLVGLSDGLGQPPGFVQADLSGYSPSDASGGDAPVPMRDPSLAQVERLALYPMAKSAYAAMDMIQEFLSDRQLGAPWPELQLDDYVLAGGGRAAWAAWLTATTDDRVSGLIPMAFDGLNLLAQLDNQYRSLYEHYSEAWAAFRNAGPNGADVFQELVEEYWIAGELPPGWEEEDSRFARGEQGAKQARKFVEMYARLIMDTVYDAVLGNETQHFSDLAWVLLNDEVHHWDVRSRLLQAATSLRAVGEDEAESACRAAAEFIGGSLDDESGFAYELRNYASETPEEGWAYAASLVGASAGGQFYDQFADSLFTGGVLYDSILAPLREAERLLLMHDPSVFVDQGRPGPNTFLHLSVDPLMYSTPADYTYRWWSEYTSRLNMPKYIINATGDEYFRPDGAGRYFGFIDGAKSLRYVPNQAHDMGGYSQMLLSAVPWFTTTASDDTPPIYGWEIVREGIMDVWTSETPVESNLWMATSRFNDFRQDDVNNLDVRFAGKTPPQWDSVPLEPSEPNQYLVHMAPKLVDYTAFFVELEFADGHVYTTEVEIVPPVAPVSPYVPGDVVPPLADFRAESTLAVIGDAVQFVDLTTPGSAETTLWAWDFGDGTVLDPLPENQNPVHTYTEAGTFTVQLVVVAGDGGRDVMRKVDYIEVTAPPPAPEFEVGVAEALVGEEVSFTDLSVPPPGGAWIVEWVWDFGDGTAETIVWDGDTAPPAGYADVTHAYAEGGTYDVSLTATATTQGEATAFRVRCLHVTVEGEDFSDSFYAFLDNRAPTFEQVSTAQVNVELEGLGTATVWQHVLYMTSQQWRSEDEVDDPQWDHWLTIVSPQLGGTPERTGMLVVSGGSKDDPSPDTSLLDIISQFALVVNAPVAILEMVPSEPLRFTDEDRSRTEDAIIAYSYAKFALTYQEGNPDTNWPVLLPMAKSAVCAMDVMQEYLANPGAGDAWPALTVDDFVVTGASKRGWTTWLTGVYDERVRAIMPMVIDVVNMDEQIDHHRKAYQDYPPNSSQYRTYGGYSTSVGDYVEMGVFDNFYTPEGQTLLTLVDPFEFRNHPVAGPKLEAMRKYIVNSSGDQFFLPDGAPFYLYDMPGTPDALGEEVGKNFLNIVPNTDHGLGVEEDPPNMDVLEAMLAFFYAEVKNFPMPRYSWNFLDDNTLQVTTTTPAEQVVLWEATNPNHRDFRRNVVGSIWESTPLTGADGVYTVHVPDPAQGWTGYFVQMKFDSALPTGAPYVMTTPIKVVPDVYPEKYEAAK